MENENTTLANHVHSIKKFFIKILVKIVKIVHYLWQHIYKSIKINQISYAPSSRKRSTLKILMMRAYTISSNGSYLKLELKHLRKVFHERNGYPHCFIIKVMNEVKRSNTPRANFQEINENENGATSKRSKISRETTQSITIAFTGRKHSSNFNVKDLEPFTKKHDVIYRSVCSTESCKKDYVCEYARRL